MINLCPNCGCEVEDNAKFCHNCGRPIDDYPIDLGTDPANGTNDANNGVNTLFAQPTVSITLAVNKANNYIKEAFSMSLLVLIASLLGFIFNIADIADVQELEYYLPLVLDEYYGVISTAINVYYAGIVLLALLVAASIVYLVFGSKLKKFNFPVYNDDVFDVAKKTFYVSIATAVILGVLCIVELVAVINTVKIQKLLEDVDFSVGIDVVFTVKDFVVFGCTLAAAIHTLKLSKCKQNDAPIVM